MMVMLVLALPILVSSPVFLYRPMCPIDERILSSERILTCSSSCFDVNPKVEWVRERRRGVYERTSNGGRREEYLPRIRHLSWQRRLLHCSFLCPCSFLPPSFLSAFILGIYLLTDRKAPWVNIPLGLNRQYGHYRYKTKSNIHLIIHNQTSDSASYKVKLQLRHMMERDCPYYASLCLCQRSAPSITSGLLAHGCYRLIMAAQPAFFQLSSVCKSLSLLLIENHSLGAHSLGQIALAS